MKPLRNSPARSCTRCGGGSTTLANTPVGSIYYGSIDSTPLFVVLLGEVHRWGADADVVAQLLPHADRALGWIEEFGDRDGDGFVEYSGRPSGGLPTKGGRTPLTESISLRATGRATHRVVRSAGLRIRGYLARSEIARGRGDEKTADAAKQGIEVQGGVQRAFWLDDAAISRWGWT